MLCNGQVMLKKLGSLLVNCCVSLDLSLLSVSVVSLIKYEDPSILFQGFNYSCYTVAVEPVWEEQLLAPFEMECIFHSVKFLLNRHQNMTPLSSEI